ncbi:MAG TPA: glycosyl hydrolase [Solirubrobacteraceae bacterium]|nr:glycosyl hydrolase [Solirubrobacteraceae bacterium]
MRFLASTKIRLILLAGACACVLGSAAAPVAASTRIDDSKTNCVYSAHEISILDQFDRLVGQQIDCVMVYNNTSTTWEQWAHPWFVDYIDAPNLDWSRWATAPGTHRQLVITQNLIPAELIGTPWLREGAAGEFTAHATELAKDLVAAGLGSSIIRLSPEDNGTWNTDSLGSTPRQWHLWDEFWSKTVEAMKSVPGANFKFDWCIAALWRPLPLSEIYPGNNVVDIIGIDAYDNGNLGDTAAARWARVYNGPDGIAAVLAFAHAHGKPISIPEWGVSPRGTSEGFGDDPVFVKGIANVVHNNDVAYQSYFYKYGWAIQLHPGSKSLAAYRAAFTSGLHQASDRHRKRSR